MLRLLLRACAVAAATAALNTGQAPGQSGADTVVERPQGQVRDGHRDFDFHIGTWRTHLRRLERPLSGSSTWLTYEGTTVVRGVWGSRANLVELDVAGPAGRIEGLSLRLYDPAARQWSLHYASSRSGILTLPVIGEFRNARGEFHGHDSVGGRSILVRFVITPITPDSIRFEQAFSDDGARTWEVNWIAFDTRVKSASPPGRGGSAR